jgi:hypothetical protein
MNESTHPRVHFIFLGSPLNLNPNLNPNLQMQEGGVRLRLGLRLRNRKRLPKKCGMRPHPRPSSEDHGLGTATVPARSAGRRDVVLTVAFVGVPPTKLLVRGAYAPSRVAVGALAGRFFSFQFVLSNWMVRERAKKWSQRRVTGRP